MSQVAARMRTSGRTHNFDTVEEDEDEGRLGNQEGDEEELPGTQPDDAHQQPAAGRAAAGPSFGLRPWAPSCDNSQQPAATDRRPLARHGKTFNDPVHGHVRMDAHFVQFIDSSPFQRLRYLAQLGCASFVSDEPQNSWPVK
jgi:hypothetical protein